MAVVVSSQSPIITGLYQAFRDVKLLDSRRCWYKSFSATIWWCLPLRTEAVSDINIPPALGVVFHCLSYALLSLSASGISKKKTSLPTKLDKASRTFLELKADLWRIKLFSVTRGSSVKWKKQRANGGRGFRRHRFSFFSSIHRNF